MTTVSITSERIDAVCGIDSPVRPTKQEFAKGVLLTLGVEKHTESRLNQLRDALYNKHSIRFQYSEAKKAAIRSAINTLIGEAKPVEIPVAKKKRKPRKPKPMDATVLDNCDPSLREILINRLPRKPYSSEMDDYMDNCPRSLDSALTKKRIQFNPPGFKSFIVVDVDRPVTGYECDDAILPPPTWVSINPHNGHAHYVWALKTPVWAGGLNQKPARYFMAIQEAYKMSLRGCDGYSHTLTKNPVHEAWFTSSPSGHQLYDLSTLAEHADFSKLKRRRRKIDRPEGFESSTHRNCDLFDLARKWSYAAVHQFEDSPNFGASVQTQLEELNLGLNSPLDSRELLHIGRSITRWVWKHKDKIFANFSKAQARRQKRSVEVRLKKRESKVDQAKALRSEGLTHSEIAKRLQVSTKTLQRWKI